MRLVEKNGGLFAVTPVGGFVGEIIDGDFSDLLSGFIPEDRNIFAEVRMGVRYSRFRQNTSEKKIFVKDWSDYFFNPELLPFGVRHIYIDMSPDSEHRFSCDHA